MEPFLNKLSIYKYSPDSHILSDAIGTTGLIRNQIQNNTGTSDENCPLRKTAKEFGF